MKIASKPVITGVISFVIVVLFFRNLNAQTMKTYPLIAKGSFNVTVKPDGEAAKSGEISIGKYVVEKAFQGELQGTSKFTMYTAGSSDGAGAYVAIENVTGTLNGKAGSFLLLHKGTMTKSSQELVITVAPGCGTGELKTLEGKFTINVVEKEHYYVFEYSL